MSGRSARDGFAIEGQIDGENGGGGHPGVCGNGAVERCLVHAGTSDGDGGVTRLVAHGGAHRQGGGCKGQGGGFVGGLLGRTAESCGRNVSVAVCSCYHFGIRWASGASRAGGTSGTGRPSGARSAGRTGRPSGARSTYSAGRSGGAGGTGSTSSASRPGSTRSSRRPRGTLGDDEVKQSVLGSARVAHFSVRAGGTCGDIAHFDGGSATRNTRCTCGSGGTCSPCCAGGASRSGRPGGALGTRAARCACCADSTCGTSGASGASNALGPLGASGTGSARGACCTCGSSCARSTGGTCSPGSTGYALQALHNLRASDAGDALRPLGPLQALDALGPSGAGCPGLTRTALRAHGAAGALGARHRAAGLAVPARVAAAVVRPVDIHMRSSFLSKVWGGFPYCQSMRTGRKRASPPKILQKAPVGSFCAFRAHFVILFTKCFKKVVHSP